MKCKNCYWWLSYPLNKEKGWCDLVKFGFKLSDENESCDEFLDKYNVTGNKEQLKLEL